MSKRSLVMTGDVKVVSSVITVTNDCLGFPVTVNHGASGNVFIEYDGPHGPISLATTNGAANMFVITMLMSEERTERLLKERLLTKFGPDTFST